MPRPFYLIHPESDGNTGYARYDANTGFFTCDTCGFELAGRDLTRPCPCGGLRRFDGTTRMVCDRNSAHAWDHAQPTPEGLLAAAEGLGLGI